MYSREKVELFLLATEDGMGPTAAAKFAGVSVGAAKKWATGHLPHSYTGARCRIVARKPPRKEASLGPDKSIYAPPATGPLAGLNEDQIENLGSVEKVGVRALAAPVSDIRNQLIS